MRGGWLLRRTSIGPFATTKYEGLTQCESFAADGALQPWMGRSRLANQPINWQHLLSP